MAEDPYADAGDDQRSETDAGLDNADIDQDGDLQDEAEQESDEDEVDGDGDQSVEPPPAASIKKGDDFAFLPQPVRKSVP